MEGFGPTPLARGTNLGSFRSPGPNPLTFRVRHPAAAVIWHRRVPDAGEKRRSEAESR